MCRGLKRELGDFWENFRSLDTGEIFARARENCGFSGTKL